MADSSDRPPSPADFLRRELEARGLTQTDLAEILDLPVQAVNGIAVGKRGISAALAKDLGEAFGMSPEYILGLQKTFEIPAELARARDATPGIADRVQAKLAKANLKLAKARLEKTYPLRDMIKRGWLTPDGNTIEEQLARFFDVSSMAKIPHLDHAAKKTDYQAGTTPEQEAWLFRVRQIANRLLVPNYSEKALRDAIPELRTLLARPEDACRVSRILHDCGVRFLIVETLPGAKIDGACFWLHGGKSPVIVLSLRFDRIDNFWFVLRHEIEHVLRRNGVASAVVDADLDADGASSDSAVPEDEKNANAAAADFCVPGEKLDSFIVRKNPFFSELDLLGFAKLQKIHPGLAAGQLRNRLKKYHLFSQHLVKIRSAVVTSAVVDGWGEVYPISP